MNQMYLVVRLILPATMLAAAAHSQQSAVKDAGGGNGAITTAAETSLHRAARSGDVAALRSQLKLGANPNARDQAGRTALIDAVEQDHLGAAQVLIESGADLDVRSRIGTALEIAERTGHVELAAALRKAGARTFGRSVGDTVCVRPWGGDGYCGEVESIEKTSYTLRVTQIVGCEHGCASKAECSADRPVGGADGVASGDLITTKSWCLTHTGVRP